MRVFTWELVIRDVHAELGEAPCSTHAERGSSRSGSMKVCGLPRVSHPCFREAHIIRRTEDIFLRYQATGDLDIVSGFIFMLSNVGFS